MLKAVLLYLENKTEQNINPSLLLSLSQNLTELIFIENDSLAVSLAQASLAPYHCLLITDTIAMAKEARAMEITCIGLQLPSTEGFFTGADCIAYSLNSLDYDTILEEYNHSHNLPSTFAITTHLIIRELTPEDMKDMINLYGDKAHVRFLPAPASLEEEIQKQKAYITHVYNFYRFGLWGVFLKDTNQLIGRCGLQCIELGDITEIELAYLIDSTFSHMGYGYEATSKILQLAREHFYLSSVIARIHKDNLPSIHLAEKLGFHFDKTGDDSQELIYRVDFNS